VEAHNGAAEAKNGAMGVFRATVADSHNFLWGTGSAFKRPDTHQRRKFGSGSVSKLGKKPDPDPYRREISDPDPHHSESRTRIRIIVKSRIRTRPKVMRIRSTGSHGRVDEI
jgi:hypothetical protein